MTTLLQVLVQQGLCNLMDKCMTKQPILTAHITVTRVTEQIHFILIQLSAHRSIGANLLTHTFLVTLRLNSLFIYLHFKRHIVDHGYLLNNFFLYVYKILDLLKG